jgi:hypothetical protein
MHTLSQKGAYLDIDKTTVNYTNTQNFAMHGTDFKPATVGEMAMISPWGPEWMTEIIDNKTYPITSVSKYKKWGHYDNTPIYKTSYLGNYYGMSSMDVVADEAVPFMGQWIRTTDDATSMTDVGTLISRPGLNRTKLATADIGLVPFQGLTQATMQIKNKAINMFSPSKQWASFSYNKQIPTSIKSIQGTIGLYNFSQDQSWELWVDNNQIDMSNLPLTISQEQNIMINDGVSYIAITPLESTHLDGKDSDNVVISVGSTLEPVWKSTPNESKVKEALRIDSYIYNSDTALSEGTVGWENLDKAYGGFAVEMADQTEYPTFGAFKTAILNSRVSANWNAAESLVEASYESGNDKLEMGYYPLYPKRMDNYNTYFSEDQPTTECFKYRNYNGASMLTSDTIDRETALAIQGTSGALQKNGATLFGGKGQKLYLIASPSNKIYNALNPAQNIGLFSLRLPGGKSISANGLAGVVNATYYESKNLVELEYAVRPGQDLTVMANAFYFENFSSNTTVKFNGTVVPKISKPSGGFAIATDSRTPNLNVSIDSLWEQPVSKPVQSISVKTPPTKINYIEEQSFDIAGMVVEATYTDNSKETVTGFTVPLSPLTIGQTSVTITYGGKTITQAITVNTKSVSSISIKTPPTKTTFVEGATFATDGEIKLNYNNGSTGTMAITSAMCSGHSMNSIGQQTITVTYSGKTTTYNITVVAKILSSISIFNPPTVRLAINQPFVVNGTISLTYTNTTPEIIKITKEMCSGFNPTFQGEQTITVTYKEKSTTYIADVYAEKLSSEQFAINGDGFIRGIETAKNVAQVRAGFSEESRENSKVYSATGELLNDTDKIGTGCKIKLEVDGNIVEEATVVITGDVKGDGEINSDDVLLILNMMLKGVNLEDEYLASANTKNDGDINSDDILLILNFMLKGTQFPSQDV